MVDTNKVVEVGRLVRDAQVKSISENFEVMEFDIAVNTTKKDGDKFVDEANYFRVKQKGKNLSKLGQYLLKGKQVVVSGYLKQDRWEKDGQKNSMVYIVSENTQLVGGKSDNSTASEAAPYNDYSDGGFPEDCPF